MMVAARLKPGQDHADPDDGEADQIGVHPARRLGLQRRVARPAGREAAEEERAQDDQVAGHEDPEREGLDARVGHAPGADHQRDQPVPQGSDDGRGGHHHHDRAVLADDGDVGARPEDVVRRAEQLGADEHGEESAGEEEQEDADGVLHPTTLWSSVMRK